MPEGVRRLRIYQQAHALAVRVHPMTLSLPKFEMYEEGSQLRRSSKSIPNNLVEGYAMRQYKAEFQHYIARAYGSAEETIEHLDLLRETESFTDEAMFRILREEYVGLSSRLFAFLRSVQCQHETPNALREPSIEYDVSLEADEMDG